MKRVSADLWGAGPVVLFVLAFALVPVAVLFGQAITDAGGWRAIGSATLEPLDLASIENSLVQGGLSAAVAVALGYPAGIFFGRYSWPGRSLLRSFLIIPFLLPSLVVVFGILDLFGPGGLASTWIPGLSVLGTGLPAIVAANLVFNVPIVVLFTATACESASVELEETIATLGGTPGRAYREVWGGPTWVGAAVGGMLTFLFSALSFAPPLLLCGPRCYTVEARIWSLDQVFLDPTTAGVLAFVMVLLFLLPTVGYLWLLSRLRALPGRREPTRRPVRRNDPLALALALESIVVLAAVGLVLAGVLYRALEPTGGAGAGGAYETLFSSATTARLGISGLGMVANTLFFATVAAMIAILLGIPAGYAIARRPRRTQGLGLFLFLPLLLSPVVLAFSLATFWRPLLGGESTIWFLVIVSQSILAIPFALQSIEIPLAGLAPNVREAAETLGATPWIAFLDADVPRVRDGLTTAGLFAFALGLGEFTATYFLVTPRFTTIPVALYRLSDARQFAVADAGAGLLLLLSLGVFLVLVLGGRRVEL
ncbi:MAG TPA: ABC transporter permease subunit [Thermoplasmata archaeon]|nr:ABC transporter permease subunit [Thermoplasmata archaeon]